MKKAILFNDTRNESHIGCDLGIEAILKEYRNADINIIHTFNRRNTINKQNQVKEKIKECDLVLVNGEGSLHHGSQFFDVVLQLLPNNKPNFLINSLWQKMYVPQHLLDKFSLISVRETKSYEAIIDFVDESKVRVVPDMVFAHNIQMNPIGYGDSVMGGLRNQLKNTNHYSPLQFKNDNYPSPNTYFSWLKSLDVYVTGRFHGVCLAALANVPFLTFPSNSHKIEGLLKDMNAQNLLISDINQVTEEKINEAKQTIDKIHKEYTMSAKTIITNFIKEVKQQLC